MTAMWQALWAQLFIATVGCRCTAVIDKAAPAFRNERIEVFDIAEQFAAKRSFCVRVGPLVLSKNPQSRTPFRVGHSAEKKCRGGRTPVNRLGFWKLVG